jgi:hypothetical protein
MEIGRIIKGDKMIFYINGILYKKADCYLKFDGGSWHKIHNSFELAEVKERYYKIRQNILEGKKNDRPN